MQVTKLNIRKTQKMTENTVKNKKEKVYLIYTQEKNLNRDKVQRTFIYTNETSNLQNTLKNKKTHF